MQPWYTLLVTDSFFSFYLTFFVHLVQCWSVHPLIPGILITGIDIEPWMYLSSLLTHWWWHYLHDHDHHHSLINLLESQSLFSFLFLCVSCLASVWLSTCFVEPPTVCHPPCASPISHPHLSLIPLLYWMTFPSYSCHHIYTVTAASCMPRMFMLW